MSPHTVHVWPGDNHLTAILSLMADIPTDLEPCRGLHNLVDGLTRAEDAIYRLNDGGALVLAAHLGVANLSTPTPKRDSVQNFQILGAFPRPTPSTCTRSKMVVVVAAYPKSFCDKILAGTRFSRYSDPKLEGILNPSRLAEDRGPGAERTSLGSVCPCRLGVDAKSYDVTGPSRTPWSSSACSTWTPMTTWP